jgi:hypothetical protein
MSPSPEVRNMIAEVFQHYQKLIFTIAKNKNLSNLFWSGKLNRRFSHIFRKLWEFHLELSYSDWKPIDENKTNTKKYKWISEYIMPATQVSCKEGREERKLSSEITEALTFLYNKKGTLNNMPTLIVFLFGRRKSEGHTWSSKIDCLCILYI